MTAKEFYNSLSIADKSNFVIEKDKQCYNVFELIKFAQAYLDNEMQEVFKKIGSINRRKA